MPPAPVSKLVLFDAQLEENVVFAGIGDGARLDHGFEGSGLFQPVGQQRGNGGRTFDSILAQSVGSRLGDSGQAGFEALDIAGRGSDGDMDLGAGERRDSFQTYVNPIEEAVSDVVVWTRVPKRW